MPSIIWCDRAPYIVEEDPIAIEMRIAHATRTTRRFIDISCETRDGTYKPYGIIAIDQISAVTVR